VASMSKLGTPSSLGGMRFLVRVAKSSSSVRKLWTSPKKSPRASATHSIGLNHDNHAGPFVTNRPRGGGSFSLLSRLGAT
jgi:hypothetical protein